MFRVVVALLVLLPASSAFAAEDIRGSERFAELESVKAFDQFMATLADMRNMILEDAVNEREASEGMRFLLRAVAMSQDVTGDGYPPAPHFARMDTPRRKVGGDNPDAEYDNLVWQGGVDYKITGNIGSVDHLSFTALVREPSGRSRSIGGLNERTLGADANGDFTLWLTGEKPDAPGAWIKTSAGDDGSMLVRQYIGDRASERLASYQIEVVGRKRLDPLPPSRDADVAAGIRGARLALGGIGRLHRYVSPSISDPPNAFKLRNSDDFGADISSADNLYVIGTYGFDSNEALIVEVDPLDVRFWNFAIESPWHESVDYFQRKTSRTHDDVSIDPDGKVRFLIAHAPSEHPNYLETAGHSRGFMVFRWVGERETKTPLPTVTKLPLGDAIARAKTLGGR
ncbi:MAG: DUF1214 domain-containing protein [Deltaproteobacteria bacterium]|nr:DUF1214 domain-containing protein [Deltaproteobacteria bacterium]